MPAEANAFFSCLPHKSLWQVLMCLLRCAPFPALGGTKRFSHGWKTPAHHHHPPLSSFPTPPNWETVLLAGRCGAAPDGTHRPDGGGGDTHTHTLLSVVSVCVCVPPPLTPLNKITLSGVPRGLRGERRGALRGCGGARSRGPPKTSLTHPPPPRPGDLWFLWDFLRLESRESRGAWKKSARSASAPPSPGTESLQE